jgi:hypothetical protein
VPTLYLRKLNDELVSHCRCDDAPVSTPPQADCPWCGCGWLLTCVRCGKPFTFARAVVVQESLEDLGRQDVRRKFGRDDAEEVARFVDWIQFLLRDVRPGRSYVYFDGFFWDTDTSPLRFEGVHAWHDLPLLPQVEALKEPATLRDVLANRHYWVKHALEHRR